MKLFELLDLDTLMLVTSAIGVVAIAFIWQSDSTRKFDLSQLVIDDTGKLSLFRTCQFGAFLASTWGFIVLTRAGKLTEWYFAGYMLAWAGVNLAKLALDAKAPKPPPPTA